MVREDRGWGGRLSALLPVCACLSPRNGRQVRRTGRRSGANRRQAGARFAVELRCSGAEAATHRSVCPQEPLKPPRSTTGSKTTHCPLWKLASRFPPETVQCAERVEGDKRGNVRDHIRPRLRPLDRQPLRVGITSISARRPPLLEPCRALGLARLLSEGHGALAQQRQEGLTRTRDPTCAGSGWARSQQHWPGSPGSGRSRRP